MAWANRHSEGKVFAMRHAWYRPACMSSFSPAAPVLEEGNKIVVNWLALFWTGIAFCLTLCCFLPDGAGVHFLVLPSGVDM